MLIGARQAGAMSAGEASVRRWTAAALPTAEAVAGLRKHPRFPEAFAAAIGHLVTIYRGNRAVSQVLNDRGRAVFGILALYLHYSRDAGGFTASRMKAICSETGLCSPGRATALLSLMRFAGYIAPAPHALDRRIRVLVPTERLIVDHRERIRGEIAAVSLLMPEGQLGLMHIEDPDFLGEMACCFGEAFRSGFRLLHCASELFQLADRNAGMVILMSLFLAREAGDTMPPQRPVAISISELSRRFGVSRPHVLKLLRDADAEGFIRIDPAEPQRIQVLPPLAEALQNFVATMLLIIAYCIRTSLNRTGQAGPDSARSA
jgi:DNA-binding MarR family transcriptional regulator